MRGFALAVDYGTSNTVALLRRPDGQVRPLLFDGSPLLSSAVYADDDGRLLSGRDAAHHARLEPARFEPNPKRCIDDLDVLLGERAYPITTLVAATLRRVDDEARAVTGGAVLSVVLTHPAEWGAARRSVLVDAAASVGWTAPVLLPEPVSAATYFAGVHDVAHGSCAVVYDLGAGTFDVSVVRRDPDGYETLACRGLDDLGGVDFDQTIIELIGRVLEPEWFTRLTAPRTLADRRATRMLREDTRAAKEQLSRSSSATVLIPLADRDVLVTREEFEAAARPLIARTVQLTRATIRAARVGPEQITGVFLVGGSTRIPLVATELHRALRIAPTALDQPELVVAEGALRITPTEPSPPAPPEQEPARVDDRGEVRFASDPGVLRKRGREARRWGVVAGGLIGLGFSTYDTTAGTIAMFAAWTLGASLALAGAWWGLTANHIRALTINAGGLTREQGNSHVTVPWAEVSDVALRTAPIVRTRTLVAVPAPDVAVGVEPWRSHYRSDLRGIRLGSLSVLRTNRADVAAAIRRFAPNAP